MKIPGAGLFVCIAWLRLLTTASAQYLPDNLRQELQQRIVAVVGETESPLMGNMLASMRASGASYIPEITAPIDVDKYQDMERLRFMNGVYWMDMTYAAVFDQLDPAARYGQAICRLLELLGYPLPGMEQRYRVALEQLNEPGGQERLLALFQEQDQDEQWKKVIREEAGMQLVVNAVYGFLIEGLYLTEELCVLSNYNPEFLRSINTMRESLQAFRKVLDLFANEPELAALVSMNERIQFITRMLNIITDKNDIGPDEINELRPLIKKARNDMVK